MKLRIWHCVKPQMDGRILLTEYFPPNNPRTRRVIIRGHYRNRMPLLFIDTADNYPRLFLGGIDVVGLTERKMTGCLLAVSLLEVGKRQRSNRLAPVRFSWDAQENSSCRSVVQKAHRSGKTCVLA